jgi:hypothetical protein
MVPVRKFIDAYLNSPDHLTIRDHMTYFESQGYTRVCLEMPIPQQIQAENWCIDNIGLENFDRTADAWWFDRPEDATLFTVRWS